MSEPHLILQLPEQREDAERSDGHEAIMITKTHEPHIVLLDIQMPKMKGFEAAREILKTLPRILILIYSFHDGAYFAETSKTLCAKGFLPKAHLASKLISAIDAILQGGSHFPVDLPSSA